MLSVTENKPAAADEVSLEDFSVFDIETGPQDEETLLRLCPTVDLPAHPGEFDPDSVKYGNTKDKVLRAEKLAQCRAAHTAAVRDYADNCARVKVKAFADFKDKAALDARYGRVVAIGVGPCPIMGDGFGIISCDGENVLADEFSGLKLFWQWVAQNMEQQRPMVGLNVFGFDLPFLVRRSWILGVSIPSGVRSGRGWNPLFIDLASVWTFGGYKEYIGLNDLAKAFGLEGKTEEVDGVAVSGKDFWHLWRSNRKVAEAYLMQDLKLPALLAVKMGVV